MKQENRLRRLEARTATTATSNAGEMLGDFLTGIADRLTGSEDVATASPAMVAALALREGQSASPAVLERVKALAACPGPVGKLFGGILKSIA